MTEILYGIEKLIYIRFKDKHQIRNILLNSFHQQCILCQTLRFLKGNQDTSRAPNNNKKPCSCQTSLRNLLFHLVPRISLISTFNHQMFTYFVQRRSFLSSRYHLNLKQAFKVKNLVPMTMRRGRYHWSRALYQVLVRMLMQKKTPVIKRQSTLSANKTSVRMLNRFNC